MNCQNCRTPLKLDHSLQDLNPAAYDLLVGAWDWRKAGVKLLLMEMQAPQATPMARIPPHRECHFRERDKISIIEYPKMPLLLFSRGPYRLHPSRGLGLSLPWQHQPKPD